MGQENFGVFLNRMIELQKIGSCEFFDPKPFIDAATILAAADEPLRAIHLLDNLPGFYRDNVPRGILDLKNKITSKMATPGFYSENPKDELKDPENYHELIAYFTRGNVVYEEVLLYNAKDIIPHIVDLGPGDYWLPIGMKQKGARFTYQSIGLHNKVKEQAREHLKDTMVECPPSSTPVIFLALEIIEHLHNETDILVDYNRLNIDADVIHISTPFYTFDGRQEMYDIANRDVLQHMRTYTPQEFHDVVIKMWRLYDWKLSGGNVMHMRGSKKSS